METIYRAHFNYTGDIPEGTSKDKIESMFMVIHNKFAKRSEEYYKIWNQKWDIIKAIIKPEYVDDEYIKYISRCLTEHWKTVIRLTPKLKDVLNENGISDIFGGDEGDTRLRLTNGTEVDLSLREVKGV